MTLCSVVRCLFRRSVSSQPASFSPQVFIITLLACSLWGLVLQFMAGYFFLHSWLNLWGELLCFADREFYSVRSDVQFILPRVVLNIYCLYASPT